MITIELKKLLFFLLFIIQSLLVLAQGIDSFKFKRIDEDQKLSNNWVRYIYQDNEDFIWFGSADGLNRFDGYECKVYRPVSEKGIVFGDVAFNHISKKNENELWLSSSNGLYIHKDQSIARINSLPALTYYFTLPENDTIAWAGGAAGLMKINPKDFSYENLSLKHNHPLYNKIIYTAYKDSKNNIWYGSTDVLYKYNIKDKTFKEYTVFDGIDENTKNDILAITEDHSGKIWIGFGQNGVFKQKDGTNEFEKFDDGLIMDLHVDKDNLLWIAKASGKGLQVVDLNDEFPEETIAVYKNDVNDPRSIGDDSIFSILEDNAGDLWFGSFGAGVNYTSKREKKFHTLTKNPDSDKSLVNNLVNAILEEENNLWIGTEGGLDRLNKETKDIEHYHYREYNRKSLSRDAIFSLCKDHQGNLWVGTWDGGLNRYNYSTNDFTRFKLPYNKGKKQAFNILAIFQDSKKRLWVGASPGGLFQYDYKNNLFVKHVDRKNQLYKQESNFVNQIHETKDGLLLYNSYIGANFFNPETEEFTYNIFSLDKIENDIKTNVLCSFIDKDHKIWVGTNVGLYIFNPSTGNYTNYKSNGILNNKSITAITQDDIGDLWVSSNTGLYRVELASNKITRFTKQDGLTSSDFKKKSVFKDNEGTLYFGTSKGLNYFDPKDLTKNVRKPNIAITSFKILESKPNENKKYRSIFENPNTQNKVSLPYKQSSFVISFTALNFLHPENNKYRYKLEGYDKLWVDAQNSRSATYTNISPGKYVFKVMASNNDGTWSDEAKSIDIYIDAPWYATQTFKTIAGLFLLILPLLFYFARVKFYQKQRKSLRVKVENRTEELTNANALLQEKTKEIERQNLELSDHRNHLEELVKGRTIELQKAKLKAEESDRLKSAFIANMSHEIRTPMNAIYGFSSLLNEDDITKEEREEYVEIINSSCDSLLVLIDDILDISILDAQGIELKKSTTNLNHFLSEIETIYKQKETNKVSIKFDQKEAEKNTTLFTDVIRLKQVLSNLINNAIKFTEEGIIEFGFENNENNITFYVSDTGIGIAQSDLKIIFNPFLKAANNKERVYRGTGIGLSISEKIVNSFGGKIWVKSTIGKGSTFYVQHPK